MLHALSLFLSLFSPFRKRMVLLIYKFIIFKFIIGIFHGNFFTCYHLINKFGVRIF